ncbi:MAG: mechanosensitive ion channel family protein [Acidobacteria bacterium]|nr:mechanosensitive ion channel family protein [Acidobacteriota bacterium]MDA1236398.1 mechanosensitive ion channel family protein [Acidobacteriota bacterium]
MNNFDWLRSEYVTLIVPYAIRVLGALGLLFAAWILAAWARRFTLRKLGQAEFDLTLSKFFSNAASYVILILAALSCLQLFGVNVTSFAAVIAAAGFAIGLAFQNSLSNFSAGIMLLVFRPFKVGDVVNTGGYTGTIAEIELFTTMMDNFDNRRIIIPNAQIFSSTIENISYHSTRRADVNVGTDYGADLDETRVVLERVANAATHKLPDKDIQVALLELGDSAISWQVRVWADSANWWAT